MPSLRFALRQLALRPGFSAVAILTLALGLAANATILGVVHQLFFQPLPVHDSERLVMLLRKSPAWPFPHGQSWPDFLDFRKQTSAFEDVLATFLNPAHLAVPGHDAERLWIEAVSANYFSLLGVRPALGSTFPDTDPEVSSPQPTVLLSHAWWTRRFGADPSVVGKTVHVNGRPFTVTGVMPRDFFGAQWGMAPSLWIAAPHVPNLLGSDASFLRNRGATAFKVMARLKPGISLPAARAIVNQTLARQLWGDEDPVGRRLHFGRSPDTCTVVGVVRDGKYVMMNEEPRPYLYLPMAQRFQTPVMFQVRTKGSPLSVASAIRGVVANLDPTLPVYAVRTMDEHLQSSALALMPLRAAALLASIQGVVALVLAIMGLYAVVAYGVSRRSREIGVRVALGAQPAQVLRLVLRDGIRLTLSGIACGTRLALVLALALSRLLHGVSPFDVAVYALVGALLAAVALVACYLPARRALRIDPLVALRAE